jgi:cobyrinic acid a,c-diamide synthase
MVARLIIAGTHSGVGKTMITAGLLAALRRPGLTVQPFKVGPDYIDPSHHTVAAGRACRNLDTWMMPAESVRSLFAHAARSADVAIIEGVMGVFDGAGYSDATGSTAEVARLLDVPVVLVVDASKMARSAAALAVGYQRFDPHLPLAGFLINRAGSPSHGGGVAAAVEKATGLPVFGWLPRHESLQIAERHLGLIPAAEAGAGRAFVDAAADAVSRYLDLDRLLAVARAAPPLAEPDGTRIPPTNGPRPIVAVARDEAFHFTYEENVELLCAAGADLAFFSPLHDAGLPQGTAGLLLSGGFPEVHAARLSANEGMRRAIRQAHEQGLPIYAECGGLMYLTESIVDLDRREHAMVGLLPGRSVMSGRLSLGYRLARPASMSWLFPGDQTVRGHEFHYSQWVERPTELPPAYRLLPASGAGEARAEGACLGNLWASYVHLHFWGRPELAERFVAACRGRSAHGHAFGR